MSHRLIELVEGLPRSRVVLLGDFMLDRYVFGNAERLSPEAPIPVLHFQHEESRPGGAGNVAAGLSALGCEVVAVGTVGDDNAADTLRGLLAKLRADVSGLLTDPARPTITKMRLVGLAQHRHAQQMIRLDTENASPLDDANAGAVVERVERALDGAAALCIEDYNKGLLRPDVCARAIAAARRRGVPVLVDPANIADAAQYAGASCLKPNRRETEAATGLPMRCESDFGRAAEALLRRLDLESVLVTLDRDGAFLAVGESERHWLRGRPRQVYDVTGAGDMVLAALTALRAGGASWLDAASVATAAGGLEVEKLGVVPISRREIIDELLLESGQRAGKRRSLPDLLADIARHRAAGRSVVFTNGCFDLVHLGHISYFQFAKRQGDVLVVAVNTDASIRRLKGDKRPIIPEDDRVRVLEELESIDYLITFDEDTPLGLIESIRPDVLVKGADYRKQQVVGWEQVESWGGRVALAPLVDGRSTSALIQRVLEAYRT